jgi:hypothetical protein
MGFVKVLMEVLDDEGGRIMTLTTSMLMGRRVAAEVAPS